MCVVVLISQYAKHMRHIELTSVPCRAVPYFSTLSPELHYFREKVIEHKMCFDFIHIFCPNISQSKNSIGYLTCT